MPFLRGVTQLDAALVHHTGSMIRFVTSQLPNLPATDMDCLLELPDGRVVKGRFHRHRENPYVGGPSVVGWIKSWVAFRETVPVRVSQVHGSSPVSYTHLRAHETRHDL